MKTLVALAATTLIVASHVGAAPTLPCGSTLFASVTLTSDLVCPAGVDALTIGADSVRIELNGYSILGGYQYPTNLVSSVGVRSTGFNKLQIIGPGRVDGFSDPIQITGGGNHVIQQVRIDQLSYVTLRNVSGSLVESNRLTWLRLQSDPGQVAGKNQILRNDIPNGYIGLRGCFTADNLVADNVISAQGYAITLYEGANRNRLASNRISTTSGGIILTDASDNYVDHNRIEVAPGNGWGIRIVANGSPIPCASTILNAWNNAVFKNEVDGGQTGIQFAGGLAGFAKDNRVTDNVLQNQSLAALVFTAGAENNDARGNLYPTPPTFIDLGRGNLWP